MLTSSVNRNRYRFYRGRGSKKAR